jgi:hypothetical protein
MFFEFNDWHWLCGVRLFSKGDAMLTLTYLADNISVTGDTSWPSPYLYIPPKLRGSRRSRRHNS